jgi:hypothetical protein
LARGVHKFDALHVASVLAGRADLFVTTDNRLHRHLQFLSDIKVMFPADALAFMENWYEQ